MHKSQQHICSFCNFTSNSEDRIQLHVVSEHSQKPGVLVCPLCSDDFREWDILENHVMYSHVVNKDYLPKIMTLVDKTDWLAVHTTPNNSEKTLECKSQNNDKSPTLYPKRQPDRGELPKKQARTSLGHPENSASLVVQMNHPTNQRIPTLGQQMLKSKLALLRQVVRHLLEAIGFDVVMQYNESSQKLPNKGDKEGKVESNLKKNEQINKELQKTNIDLPEINRSICNKCGRGFSSIWVLKTHQEEIHKDVVPFNAVEKFAKEFLEDNERRNASASVEDDSTNMAEVPPLSQELGTGASSTPAIPSTAFPLSNAATAPVTSPMADMVSSVMGNHVAQMQFKQILMSMRHGMSPIFMNMDVNMNMPFTAATNMHPPNIPIMVAPTIGPLMSSAFGHPMMPGAAVDPNLFAAQQKLFQEQQQLSQQKKRARTIINDDQLKILRAYFDLNNSPTEEQLLELSAKSGLTLKVIKRWFRNASQRNKDSLQNFNIPPSTCHSLEVCEIAGEAKISPVNAKRSSIPKYMDNSEVEKKFSAYVNEQKDEIPEVNASDIKIENYSNSVCSKLDQLAQSKRPENISFNPITSVVSDFSMSDAPSTDSSCMQTSSDLMPLDLRTNLVKSFSRNLNSFATTSSMMPLMPATSATPPTSESSHSTGTTSFIPTPSCSSGKRVKNQFTEYQDKVLKQFFQMNAYPKRDDLEYLSKLLRLRYTVIAVWFSNTRRIQKRMNDGRF